ncbi:hypothetical protein [Halalkalibacter krulwichiae]|uniref:Uncharacterized protein n=1 Tax=Halalkalibacter krulwichiae TaxID=199441 RepID=A0A1X9MGX5_9BACI|nr:hypothetical protein [Halalkalibacter krulwichiae]ARK32717.1 hypothetical protein BkAM31D_24245 [Halalkalibacter krulwichiae]
MSMPQIPKEPHRPDKKKVVIDLFESIALEEIALSHILNAEAEKIQAFVGEDLDFPTCPSNHDISKFNNGVVQLLETVVMKEWLLLRKFENVMQLVDDHCFCGKKHVKKHEKECKKHHKHCKKHHKKHKKYKC